MSGPVKVPLAARARPERTAFLVEIDDPAGMVRVWPGRRALRTSDGRRWSPLGPAARLSVIEVSEAMQRPGFQIGLALPSIPDRKRPDIVEAVRAVRGRSYLGRTVTILLASYDPRSLRPLGAPEVLRVGLMQARPEELWEGRTGFDLVMQCDDVMAFAGHGAAGWLTGTDQRERHPGDAALDFAPLVTEPPEPWPRQ